MQIMMYLSTTNCSVGHHRVVYPFICLGIIQLTCHRKLLGGTTSFPIIDAREVVLRFKLPGLPSTLHFFNKIVIKNLGLFFLSMTVNYFWKISSKEPNQGSKM